MSTAMGNQQTDQGSTPPPTDRRLGDRILAALHLALDQQALEVAEHLALALELTLTRFGGPVAVEKRDVPEGLGDAFARLDALRRSTQAA